MWKPGVATLAATLLMAENAKAPIKSSELFETTKVWNVHLKFTQAQWDAMEPVGGPGPGMGPGMGGPGMGRGPGGPPGFGGPGGPGGFGPAMFVAPALMKGDQNGDGKLSRSEFDAIADSWFNKSDAVRTGSLTPEQLSEGLNTTFEMPGGPGRGGPGGPGGPRLQAAKGKRNGMSGAMGIDFEYVHANLDFEGRSFTDVAVRYKGNATFMMSRGTLKRSMKIDLNRYTKGQELAGVTTINLHNNVTDAGWMNEVLSYRLYRDAKVPSPRTAYARVYLTVDGKYDRKYLGLYSVVEDIDSHFVQDRYRSKEGAIFKPVTRKLFEDAGSDWETYEQPYDAKTKLTAAQKNRVIEFGRLVSHAPDAEFAAKIGEFLDLDEFARYMSTTVWLSTLDSVLAMGQNFYVYLNAKTNKFEFLPWDLDHSFGQFPMGGTQEQREKLSIRHPWQGSNRLLERVFAVEAFRKPYLARMAEFNKTIFAPERIKRQVDEIAASIRAAVAEESADKVARFDKVVAGETVDFGGFGPGPGPGGPGGPGRGPGPGGPGGPGRGPGPGGPGGMRSKPIKAFVAPRSESVDQQLAGKSEGMQPGGPGGGPGGPGGPGRGPGGPGAMMGRMLFERLDGDKNGSLSREEFKQGFGRWFEAWNTSKDGQLTADQLRSGINRDWMPAR